VAPSAWTAAPVCGCLARWVCRSSADGDVLDAIPEGIRVANAVELELRGPGRLLGRVAVPRVRDAVADNLQKLKELLER
jgi:hypothetical protein